MMLLLARRRSRAGSVPARSAQYMPWGFGCQSEIDHSPEASCRAVNTARVPALSYGWLFRISGNRIREPRIVKASARKPMRSSGL